METNSLNKSVWKFRDSAKSIPTLIVGVSSIFFVLGLLIVNVHLSKYGMFSKEFLRTEYVLAGAIFALMLVSAEVGFWHLKDWYQNVEEFWKNGKFVKILLSPYMLLPLLFVPILLLLLGNHSTVSMKSIKSLGVPMTGVYLVSMNFYYAYLSVKDNIKIIFPEQAEIPLSISVHKRISKLFWPLVLILMGIAFYAKSTYPYISAVYGGGSRSPVLIYPTDRGVKVCQTLSLPINPNQSVGPLEILTESEKELTILIQNGFSEKKIAIQLNKELLDAVQTRTNDPFNE